MGRFWINGRPTRDGWRLALAVAGGVVYEALLYAVRDLFLPPGHEVAWWTAMVFGALAYALYVWSMFFWKWDK